MNILPCRYKLLLHIFYRTGYNANSQCRGVSHTPGCTNLPTWTLSGVCDTPLQAIWQNEDIHLTIYFRKEDNRFSDISFLRSPIGNRTFLISKPYVLQLKTVRFPIGERKREMPETTIGGFRKGNGILPNMLCTKRKRRKTCFRMPATPLALYTFKQNELSFLYLRASAI